MSPGLYAWQASTLPIRSVPIFSLLFKFKINETDPHLGAKYIVWTHDVTQMALISFCSSSWLQMQYSLASVSWIARISKLSDQTDLFCNISQQTSISYKLIIQKVISVFMEIMESLYFKKHYLDVLSREEKLTLVHFK